jgi:hypothetical protein
MWVNGIGPAAPATRGPARTATRAAGFSVPEQAAPAAAGSASASEVALAGMLALQEADAGQVRDRAARRHATDVLAELAALQRALLLGEPDAATLRRLADLAGAVPEADDPGLRAAVAAVILRARVELARHEDITTR